MAAYPFTLQSPRLKTWCLFSLVTFSVFVTLHAFDVIAVDDAIRAAQACRAHTNPGLSVSVVQDGRTLLSRGYGVRRGDDPADSSTGFTIASLTKAFTAALLLKVMEDDGRFNLSTKVRDIVGHDFRFKDDMRTEEATVEDLLSHKVAILPNNRLRFDNRLTRENLKDRLKFLDSPYGFRTVYIYSNLMYGLATRMTEIIANRKWEDLVSSYIFQPLGMDSSTFSKYVNVDTDKVATPVEQYLGQLQNISQRLGPLFSELAGSGSIVSTADDMAKWMNFHLSGGKAHDGKRVMSSATIDALFKPRTAMTSPTLSLFRQPDGPLTMSHDVYCMGWRRGYYRGYPVIGHSGSTYGFRNLLTLIPALRIGVFTSMRGKDVDYAFRGTLHSFLLDHVLGVTPWVNATTFCSFPAPWHNVSAPKTEPSYDTGRPLTHNISAYVGSYENPAYGRVEVRVRERDEVGQEGKDGGEPLAPLTVFYGFATWDLIPLPPQNGQPAEGDTSSEPELFYGKGRNFTAWIDYSPFAFHPPPDGSDVIVKISVPGLESRSPPVFWREGYSTSGCYVTVSQSALVLMTALVTSVFGSVQGWEQI